ncbi:hypothetical protein X745_06190 [Mesorhizobium sp. LNJC374B00]|nr:hypothetical protein X745_06190 [Mesorhizobium sp. LNJC374B00]
MTSTPAAVAYKPLDTAYFVNPSVSAKPAPKYAMRIAPSGGIEARTTSQKMVQKMWKTSIRSPLLLRPPASVPRHSSYAHQFLYTQGSTLKGSA